MIQNKKILVVEDQRIIASVYSILLCKKGYKVTIATNVKDALAKTKELNPELIIMDVQLNEQLTGIDIARQVRSEGYESLIIFTTGNLHEHTVREVADIDNCKVLIKPVEFFEIEKLL
jgi:DNA-binding response OmpR family regulator